MVNHSQGACRNPGLVTLPDGNLLTSYECDGSAILTQLSLDKGTTWSAPVSVYVPPAGYSVGLTNLTLLNSNEIWLTFDNSSSVGLNQLTYMRGTIGNGDAVSWGAPLTVEYSNSSWPGSCWSGGPLVQLPDDTLLLPTYCNLGSSAYLSSTVLRSSDGGVSWVQIIVGNGEVDGRDYDESAIAILPSGDLVMLLRQTTSLNFDLYGSYWRSLSFDDGLTWSAPVQVVNVTEVGRPTLAVLPSGGLVLMGRAKLDGSDSTGFGTSWDEGATFTPFADLGVRGPGLGWDQYDAMSILPDGTVAVVTTHGTGTVNIDYRNLIGP